MTNTPTHAELRGKPLPSVLGRGGLPPMYATWEEYATATQARAEAAERALSDLINDLSDSNQADIPIHRVAVRSQDDVLVSLAQLLEESLAVQRHILTALGSSSDSRSSVEVKTSTRGVDVASKCYADSSMDGLSDRAVVEYFATLERVQQRLNGPG